MATSKKLLSLSSLLLIIGSTFVLSVKAYQCPTAPPNPGEGEIKRLQACWGSLSYEVIRDMTLQFNGGKEPSDDVCRAILKLPGYCWPAMYLPSGEICQKLLKFRASCYGRKL
ncbi:hypothetical protein AMTR_s00058p00172040 [Amborella trichopoda]|uniref:Prolamin-like domain-containing protein n=1 Tax=Amborella trichopoda TaxID=13333 RepID=W1P9P8_AMBTC|nr:hypothetical protein AMTR_s00058p00172040 [Amborella trichopoda]